jgi:hypothetical protein
MDPRRAPKRNRREKPIMIRIAALLAAILLLTSSEARAQTYPARWITLIVPFAAGGSNDMIGRIIGKGDHRLAIDQKRCRLEVERGVHDRREAIAQSWPLRVKQRTSEPSRHTISR